VQTVQWTHGDEHHYQENVSALLDAIEAARAVTDRPSFICLKTIIGWPAPKLQGTGKAHGAALGEDEVAATKEVLGFDPDKAFVVPDEVIQHTRKLIERGAQAQQEWQQAYDKWAAANPEQQALYERLTRDELSPGWDDELPNWSADSKGIATRAASGKVLNAIVPKMPELWGGSADLAESNNTTPEGEPSFLPADRQTRMFPGNPYGRVLHFGVREHAMGAIMNGIKLHGGLRPYGGTFLIFSDYMRPAVRLAALMELPVIYVWTHDSIGLGEDGPTHQPIEHLAALRAIPGLDVVRPADANETAAAWAAILKNKDRPAGLALTRQAVPTFPRGEDGFADTSEVAKGGYILKDCDGTPDVILIGPARRCSTPSQPSSSLLTKALLRGSSRCPVGSGSTSRTRAIATLLSHQTLGPESRSRPASASVGVTLSVTPAESSASTTTEPARQGADCSRSLISLRKRSSQPHNPASTRLPRPQHRRTRQPAAREVRQT